MHSAILSTFIKLPFVFKTFVLSIFELPLKTGFTVTSYQTKNIFLKKLPNIDAAKIKCLQYQQIHCKAHHLYIPTMGILSLIYCNSEIFARILFSRKALKDILSMLKNRDFGMINFNQKRTKRFCHFASIFFAKLRICEVSRK